MVSKAVNAKGYWEGQPTIKNGLPVFEWGDRVEITDEPSTAMSPNSKEGLSSNNVQIVDDGVELPAYKVLGGRAGNVKNEVTNNTNSKGSGSNKSCGDDTLDNNNASNEYDSKDNNERLGGDDITSSSKDLDNSSASYLKWNGR